MALMLHSHQNRNIYRPWIFYILFQANHYLKFISKTFEKLEVTWWVMIIYLILLLQKTHDSFEIGLDLFSQSMFIH